MSENWYVVHTQPRGEKMLKALLDREPAVADTYLPMRQQFAIVGGQRVSRMALTMPGLVFVRGNKNQLVALLREKSGASRLMVDSSRKEKDAMVVADSEMAAFRLFNDNTAGQLMMLRSPFCNFTSADRIRIMSGPFAGYEGYIREIGGDNKLIFKVGSIASSTTLRCAASLRPPPRQARSCIKASLNTGCQPRSATTASPPMWRNIPTTAQPPAGASLPRRYAPLRHRSAQPSSTSCDATD